MVVGVVTVGRVTTVAGLVVAGTTVTVSGVTLVLVEVAWGAGISVTVEAGGTVTGVATGSASDRMGMTRTGALAAGGVAEMNEDVDVVGILLEGTACTATGASCVATCAEGTTVCGAV